MKKIIFSVIALSLITLTASIAVCASPKIILLISEQNIESPRHAWWASEVDLSATEATIAGRLIEEGYEIIEPQELQEIVNKNRAFRLLDLSQKDAVKIGNLSKADYIILGKAVASAGGNVPESRMRSCYANLSVKVIRIRDSKVISYLDASGNSAHMDVITGGKEALVSAASNLSHKIISAFNKERGLKSDVKEGGS